MGSWREIEFILDLTHTRFEPYSTGMVAEHDLRHLVYIAENVGDNPERGWKYVGKTCGGLNKRRRDHRIAAFGTEQSMKDFHVAIRKWGWESFKWDIDRERMLDWQALDHEVDLIEFFDTCHGPGYNMTEGGEGITFTDAIKEKLSEIQTRNYAKPEMRKTVSEWMKKAWATPEYRAKKEKNWTDPEALAKIGKGVKRAWANPDYVERRDKSLRESWQDPEKRKRRIDGLRKNGAKPEFKKKMGDISKKRWADPEFKKKASAAISTGRKKGHEKRRKLAHQRSAFSDLFPEDGW